MKAFSLLTLASFLLWSTAGFSRGADDTSGSARLFDRISAETGVPVDTLRAQKAATVLGYGGLENAKLLANATGQSFDDIVAMHSAGQGWGKIAYDTASSSADRERRTPVEPGSVAYPKCPRPARP